MCTSAIAGVTGKDTVTVRRVGPLSNRAGSVQEERRPGDRDLGGNATGERGRNQSSVAASQGC